MVTFQQTSCENAVTSGAQSIKVVNTVYVYSLCYLCVIPLLSGSYDLVPVDLILFLSCSSAISQLQDNKHLFYSIMRFQSKERQKKETELRSV